MATSALPGGVEQIWGGIVNFLAVIFLLAVASRAALFALASPFLTVVAFAAGNALLLSGFVAFGTGEGLLRYGIRIRCSKRLPVVRDAFSEAFGVKNRLLRYGRDIRYRKPPPTVRERTRSWSQFEDATECGSRLEDATVVGVVPVAAAMDLLA